MLRDKVAWIESYWSWLHFLHEVNLLNRMKKITQSAQRRALNKSNQNIETLKHGTSSEQEDKILRERLGLKEEVSKQKKYFNMGKIYFIAYFRFLCLQYFPWSYIYIIGLLVYFHGQN